MDREEEVVLLTGTQAFFFPPEIRKLLLPGDGGEGHGIGHTPLAETLEHENLGPSSWKFPQYTLIGTLPRQPSAVTSQETPLLFLLHCSNFSGTYCGLRG